MTQSYLHLNLPIGLESFINRINSITWIAKLFVYCLFFFVNLQIILWNIKSNVTLISLMQHWFPKQTQYSYFKTNAFPMNAWIVCRSVESHAWVTAHIEMSKLDSCEVNRKWHERVENTFGQNLVLHHAFLIFASNHHSILSFTKYDDDYLLLWSSNKQNDDAMI